MSYSTNRVVAIPAGKCPVKLQSTKKEDVIEWAEEVYSIGLRNNLNYLPSAVIFFAQQFFNIFSEEYRDVYNILSSSYNTGATEFQTLIDKINVEKRISDKEKLDKKEKQIQEENKKIKERKEQIKELQKQKKPEEIEVKELKEAKKIVIRRK